MAQGTLDISIGGYIPASSILHGLDPRIKLLGLIILLIGVFSGHSMQGAGASATLCLLLATLSGVGWRIWTNALSRFRWMLAITAGVNLFAGKGGAAATLGGYELPFTTHAVESATVLTVQLACAIVLSMALTFTSTPQEITKGCERLARPLKKIGLPVDDFVLMLLMAMRFIPLFQQELRNTIDAHRARGMDFGRGSPLERAQNLVALLFPAMVGTLRRGERLAEAMACRGFNPGAPRSEYKPLRICGRDWAGLLVSISFCFYQVVSVWQ